MKEAQAQTPASFFKDETRNKTRSVMNGCRFFLHAAGAA